MIERARPLGLQHTLTCLRRGYCLTRERGLRLLALAFRLHRHDVLFPCLRRRAHRRTLARLNGLHRPAHPHRHIGRHRDDRNLERLPLRDLPDIPVVTLLDDLRFMDAIAHRHVSADAVNDVQEDFLGPRASPEAHNTPPPAVCVDRNPLHHPDLLVPIVFEQQGRAIIQTAQHHRIRVVAQNLITKPALHLGLAGKRQLHRARILIDHAHLRAPKGPRLIVRPDIVERHTASGSPDRRRLRRLIHSSCPCV